MTGAESLIPWQVRLFSKLIIDRETGCLIYTGAKASNGYGQIMINSRKQYVHRAMYELFVEPIPAGMTVDHLCYVRRCANPAHLEAVTIRVNIQRAHARARRRSAA